MQAQVPFSESDGVVASQLAAAAEQAFVRLGVPYVSLAVTPVVPSLRKRALLQTTGRAFLMTVSTARYADAAAVQTSAGGALSSQMASHLPPGYSISRMEATIATPLVVMPTTSGSIDVVDTNGVLALNGQSASGSSVIQVLAGSSTLTFKERSGSLSLTDGVHTLRADPATGLLVVNVSSLLDQTYTLSINGHAVSLVVSRAPPTPPPPPFSAVALVFMVLGVSGSAGAITYWAYIKQTRPAPPKLVPGHGPARVQPHTPARAPPNAPFRVQQPRAPAARVPPNAPAARAPPQKQPFATPKRAPPQNLGKLKL